MSVSQADLEGLLAEIDAAIAETLAAPAAASSEEKRRRLDAFRALRGARARAERMLAEAAARLLQGLASEVSEAAARAERDLVSNTLAALAAPVAAAVAQAQALLREIEPAPVDAGRPVAAPRPPVVDRPEINDPALLRRTRTGQPVFGHVVRDMQLALQADGFDPLGVDMFFGTDTAAALQRWHDATGGVDDASVTAAEWRLLTGAAPPDLFDLCAQVTAAFEGHGFTKAVGDFDGAVATWGYHGYTLRFGHMQAVLARVEEADPGALAAAFGPQDGAALKDMLARPLERQIVWGREALLDAGKLKASWAKGFHLLGEEPRCQAAQLAYSREAFWERIALPQVERLGLTEALSHGALFDTAIQQGGLGSKRMARVEEAVAARPGMTEEEIRAAIAEAAGAFMGDSPFREDVLSRRRTFVDGTGRVHAKTYNLSYWGLLAAFDEKEAAIADRATPDETPPPLSDTVGYAAFFDAHVKPVAPNFTLAEFLTGGASNAPGGACAGRNAEPPEALWERSVALAQVLQAFREEMGAPVRVHSMYRSPDYNACIGGAAQSQHMEFRAADLSCAAGRPSDWRKALERLRARGVFLGGIGTYAGFVHVDTRGANANWTG